MTRRFYVPKDMAAVAVGADRIALALAAEAEGRGVAIDPEHREAKHELRGIVQVLHRDRAAKVTASTERQHDEYACRERPANGSGPEVDAEDRAVPERI